LPARDPRQSRAFYEDVLGLRLSHALCGEGWQGHAWLLLFFRMDDGRQLALASFRDVERAPESGLPWDARHYAFGVGALEPWLERLRAAGIDFVEEDHGAQKAVLFRDPDGNTLELTCPPTPEVAASQVEERREAAERMLERWAVGRP